MGCHDLADLYPNASYQQFFRANVRSMSTTPGNAIVITYSHLVIRDQYVSTSVELRPRDYVRCFSKGEVTIVES